MKTACPYNRISIDWPNGKWGMEFHPQKCSVLSVTRSRSPIKHPYKLKGHILEVQDCTKYLGVNLQSSMSWKNHIDRIPKKANSTLGFLRPNLKAGSEETKSNAYFCMVRSNLEYCCSVWSSHHKEFRPDQEGGKDSTSSCSFRHK